MKQLFVILAILTSACSSPIEVTVNESAGTTNAGEVTTNEPVDVTTGEIPDGESVEAPVAGPVAVSYGESYGECIGYCDSTLRITDGVVELSAKPNGGQPPRITQAALSSGLVSRLTAAVSQLELATLQPVYGCPDCADGGATTFSLSSDGQTQTHQWEVGNPPEALAALDTMLAPVLYAMHSCESIADLSLADPCVPIG